MAHKPGACDLRCSEAVLSAMLAHPRHGRRADFLAWGAEMVRGGNWAFARHLPRDVARRALEVERLLALGETQSAPPLARAGRWMLDQHRAAVELPRRAGRRLSARDLYTAHYVAEFRAAQDRHPHMKLARSCFMNVPVIQTALALRALIALGLGEDPRAEKSFESLLDLRLQPGEKPSGKNCQAGPFGNWCAHQIRFKIEDRLHAEKGAR